MFVFGSFDNEDIIEPRFKTGHFDQMAGGSKQSLLLEASRLFMFNQDSPLLENVLTIASGWDCYFAAVSSHVYAFGDNTYGQLGTTNGLINFQVTISKISCGLRHTLFLTVHGKVYACGANRHGQCGITGSANSPTLLPYDNVIDIATGQYHSLILTSDRRIYAFGKNNFNQLGCLTNSFNLITIPNEVVKSIFSSWSTCGAICESGNVYTWGRNNFGQMGVGQQVPQTHVPHLVPELKNATMIAMGSEHGLAIIDSKCVSWGWNEHGMLGMGHTNNLFVPKLVPLPTDLIVDAVGCGAGHSFVSTVPT
jgi:alpha-tubulin suppressor-like RCC1 family protein